MVQARDRIRRAEAIIVELNYSLDMSHGAIPKQLRFIYLFCKRHLVQSSIQKDPAGVEAVIGLLSELRDAWERIAATQVAGAA